jgi:hypothetical protein
LLLVWDGTMAAANAGMFFVAHDFLGPGYNIEANSSEFGRTRVSSPMPFVWFISKIREKHEDFLAQSTIK